MGVIGWVRSVNMHVKNSDSMISIDIRLLQVLCAMEERGGN